MRNSQPMSLGKHSVQHCADEQAVGQPAEGAEGQPVLHVVGHARGVGVQGLEPVLMAPRREGRPLGHIGHQTVLLHLGDPDQPRLGNRDRGLPHPQPHDAPGLHREVAGHLQEACAGG